MLPDYFDRLRLTLARLLEEQKPILTRHLRHFPHRAGLHRLLSVSVVELLVS